MHSSPLSALERWHSVLLIFISPGLSTWPALGRHLRRGWLKEEMSAEGIVGISKIERHQLPSFGCRLCYSFRLSKYRSFFFLTFFGHLTNNFQILLSLPFTSIYSHQQPSHHHPYVRCALFYFWIITPNTLCPFLFHGFLQALLDTLNPTSPLRSAIFSCL